MKSIHSTVAGITVSFLVCVGIVLSVSAGPDREGNFLGFHQSFNSSPSTALPGQGAVMTAFQGTSQQQSPKVSPRPSRGKGKKSKKNKVFKRTFSWFDPAKAERKTVFNLKNSDLKSEIRRFGQSQSMDSALHMKRRGFKIVGRRMFLRGSRVMERVFTIVDYKEIYERHLPYFPALTGTLFDSTALKTEDDPLQTFLNFVQHIPYKRPPQHYRGRFIGGFFIPLVCLYEQYGDCDSKAMLLAEFLASYRGSEEKTAMVLIRGQGLSHALLGVRRKPLPGMTSLYVQQQGYYVVLETTRPGWAPGFIDRRIFDALKGGFFQLVELN